jgi:hypothetical protein
MTNPIINTPTSLAKENSMQKNSYSPEEVKDWTGGATEIRKNDQTGEVTAKINNTWVPIVEAARGDDDGEILVKLQEPSMGQQLDASTTGQVVRGMTNPARATDQFLSKTLPEDLVNKFYDANNQLSDFTGGYPPKFPEGGIDERLSNEREDIRRSKILSGKDPDDRDLEDLGNFGSPLWLAAGALAPIVKGGNRIIQAAKGGGLGLFGSMFGDPVEKTDEYGMQLLTRGSFGFLFGAGMPYFGEKIAEAIIRRFNARKFDEESFLTSVGDFFKDRGESINDIPREKINKLRTQVKKSIDSDLKDTPQSLLRKQDFKDIGATGTTGQIYQSPSQFSLEKKVARTDSGGGATNVGLPLEQRFEDQEAALKQAVDSLRVGDIAPDVQSDSIKLAEGLRDFDKKKTKEISDLYDVAEADSGIALDVPMEGLADDLGKIMEDYPNDGEIPNKIINKMKSYGLLGGKQTKVFTIKDSNSLLKLINSRYKDKKASKFAMDELREAVKRAVSEAAPEGSPYAPAVAKAREKFKLQEKNPILQDISEQGTADDEYIQKFIIRNKNSKEIESLVTLLKENNPKLFDKVKNQVVSDLARAAYGKNLRNPINPNQLGVALQTYGSPKLKAFFNEEEMNLLKKVKRVASYIKTKPTGRSEQLRHTNWSLLPVNVISPTVRAARAGAISTEQYLDAQKVVDDALNTENLKRTLTDKEQKLLAQMLSAGTAASTSALTNQLLVE